MKKIYLQLLPLILFLLCLGCSTPITGKIVDAETGQPIEGAILLVEWSKVHGFGNTYTASEKAVEVFSDKDGIVHIPGYNDPFAEKPEVTIYKQGYVAWNNLGIFVDNRTIIDRTDFTWKDGYVFRLERFKPEFTHNAHSMFIYKCIGTRLHDQKSEIIKATQFERDESQKEFNERMVEMEKQKTE